VTTAAIAAHGLAKRFGRAAALRGVEFEIPVGSSLAVLGPNGAGKSTLLRLIAGLARPSAGSVEVRGIDCHRRRARAGIGYIGHATLLYPALTARENLLFAARCHAVRDPQARADALLEESGLGSAADRKAGEFSRGMAQRLAIARSLVHDPDLVLLDEPFTGLDRVASDRFSDRIDAMHRDGRTLVLVTHDLRAATRFADRAIVLARGQIRFAALDAAPAPDALERAYIDAADASA